MAMLVGVVQTYATPNIIVILTDDQGVDAIEGIHWPNDLNVHTPNLAALAQQGRVFANARVNPVGTPTRAGLFTGRSGFQTGVVGPIQSTNQVRHLISMQSYETTIAEILRDAGYDTLLMDVWRVGTFNGQDPIAQGFDVYRDTDASIALDDPAVVGDEHVTRMVDLAVSDVQNRTDPTRPYALFFSGLDPHDREQWNGGRDPFPWWKVDTSLLPSGELYYDPPETSLNRYRAVVEAMDTELGRLLRELDVIDESGQYRPESETVVFFLSDNGTPADVAMDADNAKGSLFDGGIRVPMFVFGDTVPTDGALMDRPVSHVDLYDTIADIAGIADESRGERVRESQSFADLIGWSGPLDGRQYTLSHLGSVSPANHTVALCDGIRKLITTGGRDDLVPITFDSFYNLVDDPSESNNLIPNDLSGEDLSAYLAMKEVVANYWPSAVTQPTPLMIDVPMSHSLGLTSRGDRYPRGKAPVGFFRPDLPDGIEGRAFYRFSMDALQQLLPPNKTIDDIVDASIVLRFKEEAPGIGRRETDTGLITAYPMFADWFSTVEFWDDVADSFDESVTLGSVDVMPHIWPRLPGDLWGIPIVEGTPISLGSSDDLVTVVQTWFNDRDTNRGVVLISRVWPELGKDQTFFFKLSDAVLRVTVQ